MSQTKAQLVSGTTAQNLTVDNINTTSINSGQASGRKNLIVNGAMICSQRGSSFAAANNIYTLDRYKINGSHDGAVTISQSTTSPDGFSKSFKVDVTSADTSIASGQYIQINTRPEAQDLQVLAYGTSAAKTITVSFWVRSNLTGTYTFAIQQADNSSKQVSQTYTINSANTWEKKTFTFAGDTSGVINDDDGVGFQINWNLAIGSQYTTGTSRSVWTTYADADFAAGHTANILSSTSNEFYLTGFQLEVGSTATDFEHRSYGQELALCHRYYFKPHISSSNLWPAYQYHSQYRMSVVQFPTTMRATPTCTPSWGHGSDSDFTQHNNSKDHFKAYRLAGYDAADAYYLDAFTADAEL